MRRRNLLLAFFICMTVESVAQTPDAPSRPMSATTNDVILAMMCGLTLWYVLKKLFGVVMNLFSKK